MRKLTGVSKRRKGAAGALRGLLRRREILALARAAHRRGTEAWIVGGAPRDALIGLPVPEIDVAVSKDAEGLAEDLEREGIGRAVFLSRGRPGPRVFRVAGKRPLDVAELEGASIAADLARRDFTVNAIAVAIPSGTVVDPFAGLAALTARRLRCVRSDNIAEDPLRILRAARLFATHGLWPDDGVLAASRAAANLFARVAPERVGAELAKLLASRRAAPALAWAARAGILAAALGCELSRSRAAALARSLGVLDSPAVGRIAPERRRRLRLALLALRLRLSPLRTRAWLESRRWPREESRRVAALRERIVDAPGVRDRGTAMAWILAAEREDVLEDSLALLSRLGTPRRRRAYALGRLARRPRPKVRVSGGDVMRWSGLEPGPRVGELLEELRVAAATGEVQSRREARNWLRGQVPGGL